MSNKLILFTIPGNMISTVEQQTNERKIAGEQPVTSKVEGVQPTTTKRVEAENITQTFPNQLRKVSDNQTPQTISAIQENFVEDKGGIGAISKTEWRSELDIKAGGNYSVDISTISNN